MPKKRPRRYPHCRIDIDNKEMIVNTMALTPAELGRFVRELFNKAVQGDRKFVESCRFVKRFVLGPPEGGRRQFSVNERRSVFEKYGYACRHCSATDDLQLDHIIPLARGGPDELHNLQPLCRTCNLRKGAKMPPTEAINAVV